jgi:hypothetical protein
MDTAHFSKVKPLKPLNGKAYGSIGHMPQSRVGPGDWHVHEGQARICCEKPRKGDRIIVTEKLDGACMSVANIDGQIVALSRAGYAASDALYEHLREFVPYVERNRDRFSALLSPGERVVGEWLAMAHGTIYDPYHDGFAPFIPFDIFRGNGRILRDEFVSSCDRVGLTTAHCVHDGVEPMSIEAAVEALGPRGFHGSTEAVEGAVWRVEREDRVDFLAKFVRKDKIDGAYLPNIAMRDPIWHWRSA